MITQALTKKQWGIAIAAAFVLVSLIIAIGVWVFLNITAQLTTGYSKVKLDMPDELSTLTTTHGGQVSQMSGSMNTAIPLDAPVQTALRGRFPVDLKFRTDIPMTIRVDLDTQIPIQQILTVNTTTELIFESNLIPDIPLTMDIPVDFDVPFSIHEDFDVVADVSYDSDKTFYEFDESFSVPVNQTIDPVIAIDDPIRIVSLEPMQAKLYDIERKLPTSMDIEVQIPLKNAYQTLDVKPGKKP